MPVGVWGARGVFWLVVAGGVSLRGSAVFRFGVLCVTVVGGVGGVVSRASTGTHVAFDGVGGVAPVGVTGVSLAGVVCDESWVCSMCGVCGWGRRSEGCGAPPEDGSRCAVWVLCVRRAPGGVVPPAWRNEGGVSSWDEVWDLSVRRRALTGVDGW